MIKRVDQSAMVLKETFLSSATSLGYLNGDGSNESSSRSFLFQKLYKW